MGPITFEVPRPLTEIKPLDRPEKSISRGEPVPGAFCYYLPSHRSDRLAQEATKGTEISLLTPEHRPNSRFNTRITRTDDRKRKQMIPKSSPVLHYSMDRVKQFRNDVRPVTSVEAR